MKKDKIVFGKGVGVAVVGMAVFSILLAPVSTMAMGPFGLGANTQTKNNNFSIKAPSGLKKITAILEKLKSPRAVSPVSKPSLNKNVLPKGKTPGASSQPLAMPQTKTVPSDASFLAKSPAPVDPFGIKLKGYPSHYVERVRYFEQNLPSQGKAQFIGDSNTEGLFKDMNDWLATADQSDPYYPYVKSFVDRYWDGGIAGDTSGGILNRLNLHLASKPSELVVMIGTNDYNMKALADHYSQIISRAKGAGTKVVFVSVIPRDIKNNSATVKRNSILKSICDSNGVEFVNEYPYFVGKGNLYKNTLHFNVQGRLEFVKNFSALHQF